MKNLFYVLVIVCTLGSCSNELESSSKGSSILDNMELDPNFDLSKAKFPATKEGFNLMLQEMTTEVYGATELSPSLKFFQSEGFYVVERLDNTENTSAKPCKTETITCTNADEVKAALTKIIGDGTRDVNISYDRQLVRVVISYAYQDC